MSNYIDNSCRAFGNKEQIEKLHFCLESAKQNFGSFLIEVPELENFFVKEVGAVEPLDDENSKLSFVVHTNYINFDAFDFLEKRVGIKIAVSVIDDSEGEWFIYHDPEQTEFSENILIDCYGSKDEGLEHYEFFDDPDSALKYLESHIKVNGRHEGIPVREDYYSEKGALEAWDEFLRYELDCGLIRIANRI